MHTTTTSATRTPRRLVFLTLLAALLLLALAQAAPVFAASVLFDGGPVAADTATMLANDHTVYALRFSNAVASANPAIPDGTYYVKVRLTPNADGSPAGVDNRGFTWNGTSGTWVQEREDWTAVPDRDGDRGADQHHRHQPLVLLQVRRHHEERAPTAC